MADEADVDIEGDELDASLNDLDRKTLLQDEFLQSAWKTSTGILPWELDSSISAENRKVIESMLLEEQYYLTGREIPQTAWQSNSTTKAKVRKSPAKASAASSSTRWSPQENKLFEEGVAQFGRRWTKIAKLVGSRTVLQVKSYARQYFKHHAKSAPLAAAPPTAQEVQLQAPQPSSSTNHTAALINAVRIKKLSDNEDEEVDITDDLSDEGDMEKKPQVEVKMESKPSEPAETTTDSGRTSTATKYLTSLSTASLLGHQTPSAALWAKEAEEEGGEVSSRSLESKQTSNLLCPAQDQKPQSSQSERCGQGASCRDKPDAGDDKANQSPTYRPYEDQGGAEEEEEEEELKAPEQEVEMDLKTITEEEKQAIPEFFEGRLSKTPERYLKIRNFILEQWMKSKPRYLNKTSVRPGLKNCGDVNCIGRVHTFLELIGAINFNCDQAVYNRPRVMDRSKHKEGRDTLEAYQLAQRLQSMRTRKRRVRDLWGNWCNPKDLEGHTYEHLSAEELARRRGAMKTQPKPCKIPRYRLSFDPFQLIMCRSFGEDIQEPFQVTVCSEALLIMDMHAHVSRGEVIGLLGGIFHEQEKVLKIRAAEPCNSMSTGMQCEMDPVSQTQACETLASLGLSVVGWYHSHPTFHPNPSLRDIHTQDQFQSYFSRGGAPFIGMIVSPYDPLNASPHSQTTCLLVKEHQEASGCQKLPYRFDFQSSQDVPDWEQLMRRSQWIISKYSQAQGSVRMDRFFRKGSHLTCLEKMLSSLARYLEPLPEDEGEPFLTQIQALFQSDFIGKQSVDREEEEEQQQEEEEEEGGGEEEGGIDDSPCDPPINEEHLQEDSDGWSDIAADWDDEPAAQKENSETEGSPVLHLGSVLLTGHDYLL